MSALADKIRMSRQVKVELGGFSIYVRRPTSLEMHEIKGSKITQREILSKFVTGWEGVKEMDLYSGGTSELVPYDKDACDEFLADNPMHWNKLTGTILDEYKKYESKIEELLKNSQAG
jgi:hypothetical protein